jgi:ATP-binding protein involved in chromosome partitioning
MAGFTTPDGQQHQVFGSGGGAELAAELRVAIIGSIPIDPAITSGGDDGRPIVVAEPGKPAARAFAAAAHHLVELVPPAADETCTARLAVLMEQVAENEA